MASPITGRASPTKGLANETKPKESFATVVGAGSSFALLESIDLSSDGIVNQGGATGNIVSSLSAQSTSSVTKTSLLPKQENSVLNISNDELIPWLTPNDDPLANFYLGYSQIKGEGSLKRICDSISSENVKISNIAFGNMFPLHTPNRSDPVNIPFVTDQTREVFRDNPALQQAQRIAASKILGMFNIAIDENNNVSAKNPAILPSCAWVKLDSSRALKDTDKLQIIMKSLYLLGNVALAENLLQFMLQTYQAAGTKIHPSFNEILNNLPKLENEIDVIKIPYKKLPIYELNFDNLEPLPKNFLEFDRQQLIKLFNKQIYDLPISSNEFNALTKTLLFFTQSSSERNLQILQKMGFKFNIKMVKTKDQKEEIALDTTMPHPKIFESKFDQILKSESEEELHLHLKLLNALPKDESAQSIETASKGEETSWWSDFENMGAPSYIQIKDCKLDIEKIISPPPSFTLIESLNLTEEMDNWMKYISILAGVEEKYYPSLLHSFITSGLWPEKVTQDALDKLDTSNPAPKWLINYCKSYIIALFKEGYLQYEPKFNALEKYSTPDFLEQKLDDLYPPLDKSKLSHDELKIQFSQIRQLDPTDYHGLEYARKIFERTPSNAERNLEILKNLGFKFTVIKKQVKDKQQYELDKNQEYPRFLAEGFEGFLKIEAEEGVLSSLKSVGALPKDNTEESIILAANQKETTWWRVCEEYGAPALRFILDIQKDLKEEPEEFHPNELEQYYADLRQTAWISIVFVFSLVEEKYLPSLIQTLISKNLWPKKAKSQPKVAIQAPDWLKNLCISTQLFTMKAVKLSYIEEIGPIKNKVRNLPRNSKTGKLDFSEEDLFNLKSFNLKDFNSKDEVEQVVEQSIALFKKYQHSRDKDCLDLLLFLRDTFFYYVSVPDANMFSIFTTYQQQLETLISTEEISRDVDNQSGRDILFT